MNQILNIRSTCETCDPVTEVGVLIDGKAYYSMFYEAALQAEKYILLSGWQFDSKVSLLRGEEAARAETPTTLLAFLNHLCEQKPDLHIYLLAWDFSVVFALEREWLQKLAFDWMAHERLHFAFDKCVPLEGSHHQKYVVIDGELGFLGGTDLCEHRWDDRSHTLGNPERYTAEEEIYAPYHEVHGYMRGPAVTRLVEFFEARWNCAGDTPLTLAKRETAFETPKNEAFMLPAREVALSRTAVAGPGEPCNDVREMYESAIMAAERFIYCETQYFTAHAIVEALSARMCDATRPKLTLVFVLPVEPEAPKEELAMGVLQARAIARVREIAAEHGHTIGFYSSASVDPATGNDVATYIHSKLIVVDDRFLSFGSANLSNRSMGVDTELNLAFETESAETELGQAIRDLRVTLLSEHVGATSDLEPRLADMEGLVAVLDALALGRQLRVRPYDEIDPSEAAPLLAVLHASVGQYLDPDRPRLADDLEAPERWGEILSRGFSAFKRKAS